MERILIVTDSEKRRELFQKLVSEQLHAEFSTAASSGEAWRMITETPYSLILVIAPLPDEFGTNLARMAVKTTAGVMLAAKAYQLDEVRSKLGAEGVMLFATEMGRTMFSYAISLLLAVHRRLSAAEPQAEMLQQKIRDLRIIDRAKCILIQCTGMTEQEAHRTIEKAAMDERISRREAAQKVLDYYDI